MRRALGAELSPTMNRRSFLTQSLAATAALGTGVLVPAQTNSPAIPAPAPGTEPKRSAPFDLARVKEFVGAGHGNLPRVKEMLAEQPKLVLASYDWGAGDFETGRASCRERVSCCV